MTQKTTVGELFAINASMMMVPINVRHFLLDRVPHWSTRVVRRVHECVNGPMHRFNKRQVPVQIKGVLCGVEMQLLVRTQSLVVATRIGLGDTCNYQQGMKKKRENVFSILY